MSFGYFWVRFSGNDGETCQKAHCHKVEIFSRLLPGFFRLFSKLLVIYFLKINEVNLLLQIAKYAKSDCFGIACMQFYEKLKKNFWVSIPTLLKNIFLWSTFFNVNTFLKLVYTLKSWVTYDLDTDRVTYDLDTTTHKIIGVVGSPSTSLRLYYHPSKISSFTVVEKVFTLTVCVLTQTAEFYIRGAVWV